MWGNEAPEDMEFRRNWQDLVGATVGLGCGIGMYTPITSIFFRALETQFGWSKTAIAASLFALPLTGVATFFAGSLIDRFDVRRVAFLSATGMAFGFLFLSMIGRSLPAFYLGFFGFNLFGCATAPVAYTRPLAARFSASKGMAIAIALSGISISSALLSPILGSILAQGGWRTGYRLLAAVALFGGAIATAMIRPAKPAPQINAADGVERAQAFRTREFWQLGLAVFLAGGASVGFVSQLQTIAIEYGAPIVSSGLVLAVLAISVLVFRIVAGWSLDHFAPGAVAAVFFIASALGIGLWLLPHGTMAVAIIGTVALGLSVGSEHAFMSFFCARLFGKRAYSSIFGGLALFLYVGMAAGGMTFARSRDLSGSYKFAICGAVIALIAAGFLLAHLPARADHLKTSGR